MTLKRWYFRKWLRKSALDFSDITTDYVSGTHASVLSPNVTSINRNQCDPWRFNGRYQPLVAGTEHHQVTHIYTGRDNHSVTSMKCIRLDFHIVSAKANDGADIQIPIYVLHSCYSMDLLWSLHYWVCAFSVAMTRDLKMTTPHLFTELKWCGKLQHCGWMCWGSETFNMGMLDQVPEHEFGFPSRISMTRCYHYVMAALCVLNIYDRKVPIIRCI